MGTYHRSMPTSTERKALLFLGAVACLGGGARVIRAREVPPPVPQTAAERRPVEAQLQVVDSTRRAKRGKRNGGSRPRKASLRRAVADSVAGPVAARGVTPRYSVRQRVESPITVGFTHRVDVDQASAVELQTLPGIGPVLAARIVADRDSNGPFGSLEHLQRVS